MNGQYNAEVSSKLCPLETRLFELLKEMSILSARVQSLENIVIRTKEHGY